MLENTTLPQELETLVGSEIKDFAVKAKHAAPPKASLAMIIFGAVWLAFSSIFLFAFLGPLFRGEEVHFLTNDVPTVASPDNLRPIPDELYISGIPGVFEIEKICRKRIKENDPTPAVQA